MIAANGAVFPLDDAYITLHNARALLSGQDENYGVSPLIGATSPIHLALTAAALLATPQPALAALAVNTLGAIVYLLGAAALADQRGLGPWRKAAVLIIAAGSGYSAFHLFNGLETSWAMAGVVWALALAGRPRLGPALPILCGLLPFLRPELAALSGLLLAHQGVRRWKSGHSRWPTAFALDLALSAAAAAPWIAWMLAETGALSPATGAAKRAFFAESGLSTPRKLAVASLAMALGLGALLPALAMAPRSALTLACWGFALAFFFAFAATLPGGLFHNHYRYVYVLLPVCIWALCQTDNRRLLTIALVICLAAAVVSTTRAVAAYGDGQEVTRQHLGLARWAQANLPADARILVHDAGVPAYATNRRLIDLVGLKTPPSMQAHLRLTEPSRGDQRGEAIDAIARNARPSHVIILHDTPLFWGKIASNLRDHGWTLSPIGPATPTYRLYALDRPPPSTAERGPLRLRPAD
ncbi:MAG: hypothetical protein C0481_18745 [Phenylobacterium sp.]|nr:hypothetical protein [Phenylobacterium sp.]